MQSAIEKAWEENLKLDQEDQYKSKEEIIETECVCNCSFDMPLGQPKYCTDGDDNEICTKCWSRPIEEDKSENNIIESESTFEKLKDCSVEDISLNELNEKEFKDLLTNNSSLIYVSSSDYFTYENLPIIATYLLEVYDYAKELKDRVEYVDWKTARNHMEQEGKCKLADIEYFIKDNTLYWEFKSEPAITTLSLAMLDSNKWILL